MVTAGANFIVGNGAIILQGIGYTTVAGGGAFVAVDAVLMQKRSREQGGFNIDVAIDFLNSKAYSPDGPDRFGNGQCSPFVPNAINAGFGYDRIPTTLAGSAYGPSLREAGFTDLRIQSLADYTPLKGDIAVMNGPFGGKMCNTGIGGPCGHIQMYNGGQWVSDFFQLRKFWPGASYEDANPQLDYEIYRWLNINP